MAQTKFPARASELWAGPEPSPSSSALLSFAQSRWWFLDQLDPGNPVFNAARALRLSGPLDVELLTRSLSEVVRRHHTLRTRFLVGDGTPVQDILPSGPIHLPLVDLTTSPVAERHRRARDWTIREARKPFELTREPGYRAVLIRMGAEEHLLVQVFHHIVSDGWSMGILFRELTTVYAALAAGRPSPLPELQTTYADFAALQRQRLQGSVLEAELAYWRERLRGAQTALELLTDHPRPATQTHEGTRVSFSLPTDRVDALTRLSHQERVSLFMTLFAGFNALLWRHSGQTDLVVGIPTAGRTRVEIEQLIGCFANTLVLRTDITGNPTFHELLGRVRETALGAYAHQDLPFAKLVEELQPARNLGHNPLFQVLFNFRDFPPRSERVGGLNIEDTEVDLGVVMADLEIVFVRDAYGLTCRIVGNTRLFDPATLERFGRHYQEILEAVAEDPTRRLSAFAALTAGERQQVTVEWNDTSADWPTDRCVHHLFEAQAARTPDRVALVFGETRLTYRELDQCSNRLAHYLQRRGVGPALPVGLYFERSPSMVIGLLAVLKAGAAYLPLDPAHPKERLRFLLQDAAPAVVLTESSLLDNLPEVSAIVVCLEREQEAISREPDEKPVAGAAAEYPAYLIYTSGSTGQPKGVVVPHQALVNFLESMRRCPGLTADDVLVAVTTLSFDIAGLELLLPLTVGAKLVLASREVAADGQRLATLLARSDATVMQATPSTWRLLLEAGWKGSRKLRALCGGEILPGDLAAVLQQRCAAVWNLYGPTETTIWSTVHAITAPLADAVTGSGSGSIPIGRPIANTQVHILDRSLELVPVGVPGELCIGGLGVACGYLNRPGLTAEKFVPDPFSTVPGARLYRTGDRARWRPDGILAFLGRLDHQVKILGHRIEPGEVETALAQHDDVQACAVVAQEDRPGEARLVGYVVTARERAPSIVELRAFLKERLPGYMVPGVFVVLDALPLTANGKLDRQALPLPSGTRSVLASKYVPPRTPVEQELANLWTSLLKVDRVGLEDNFFELGGHSLLASQVIARARVAFGVELPLRTLFEEPTVAGLSLAIDQVRAAMAPEDAEWLLWELDQLSEDEAERLLSAEQASLQERPQLSELHPIPQRPVGATAPLSFAQQRMWFYNQLEPDSFAYNQARATRWLGALDVGALERSLAELARRHEVLRGHVELGAAGPVHHVAAPAPVPLIVKDLTGVEPSVREDVARQWVVTEARRPFDLSGEAPVRAMLLRLASDGHVLALVIHHIAFDRWSSAVLFQELATLYSAFAAGSPSPLPELALQYGDYAEWQRKRVHSDALSRQLAYWSDRLHDLPATLELPLDRPRPAIQTHRGESVTVALAVELTAKLESVSRSEGASLFMTLLAGFQTLLWHHTGQTDLPVGVVNAGRTRLELESLIGCFTNTLVMRTDLSLDPSFRELLGRVRGVALGAFASQDLPFEKLVEELRPERSVQHHPLFQVLMNYLDIPQPQLSIPGLRVDEFEVSLGTAFVDLALDIKRKGPGFTCSFAYNTDLFDRITIEHLAADYLALLEGVVTNPEARLSTLSLLIQGARPGGTERLRPELPHVVGHEPAHPSGAMARQRRHK